MSEERLAQSGLGRILLHCLCAWRNHHYRWHWRCISREISHLAARKKD